MGNNDAELLCIAFLREILLRGLPVLRLGMMPRYACWSCCLKPALVMAIYPKDLLVSFGDNNI